MAEQEEKENINPKKKSSWIGLIFSGLFRLVKYSLGFSLILIVSVLVLLQFSFFQTLIVQSLFKDLSTRIGYQLKASSVYINFFNSRAYFKDLSVKDLQNQQMIYIYSAEVDFDYHTIAANGDILLNQIILNEAVVNLITDANSETLNITEFIARLNALLSSGKKSDPKKPGSKFRIAQAKIINGYFGFDDRRNPPSESEGMDFSHFGVDELYADLENFLLVRDTIEVQIHNLKGIEPNKRFRIHQLSTFYKLNSRSMGFDNLLCKAGKSVIRDHIFFNFSSQRALSDFNEKVTIIGHLDSTVIDTDDLAVFAPAVKKFKDTWRISGTFRGKVNDFSIKDLDLHFGLWSQVKGSVAFSGLPDFETTFMQLELSESKIIARELEPYILQKDVMSIFQKFGVMTFDANLTGFPNDFVAHGSFETLIGSFESDINLKLKENRVDSYYKGDLKTTNLNIGLLFGLEPLVQTIDFEGSIEGTGLSPENAELKLDAHIKSLVFNKYRYQDIRVDGKLSRERFDGELLANDPNFNLTINGVLDFNKDPKHPNLPAGRFDLETNIIRVSLGDLNFSPVEAILQGKLTLDTYGLNLDSLIGEAVLSEASFIYNDRGLTIQKANLLSFKTDNGGRFFEFQSEFLDFSMDGDFIFSSLLKDLEELSNEYLLSFRNIPEEIEAYYRKKREKEIKRYSVNYHLDLKNLSPVLSLFANTKGFYISKDAKLKGRFSRGKATTFTCFSENSIDSLRYNNYEFYSVDLDLNSSKIVQNNTILAAGIIESKRQVINQTETENLIADITWGENLINFEFRINQYKSTNHARLLGTVQFTEDSTLVAFKPSDFMFLNETWKISETNHIVMNKQKLSFDNLIFYNEMNASSSISLNGVLSDTLREPLILEVKDVDIYPFAHFVGQEARGSLNAYVGLRNMYDNPEVLGTLNLENFFLDNILIGDIDGEAEWNQQTKKLDVNVDIYRNRRYILALTGDYTPSNEKNSLNFRADLRSTDIEILSPFIKGIASNLRGTLDGSLNISGTLKSPLVKGRTKIRNGRFRLDYLNTTYDLEGDVLFEPDQIITQDVLMFDQYSNPATLEAQVFHDSYKDFYLQLQAKFYDFQLLNTGAQDNSLFYGAAFGSGDLSIAGYINNLQMNIKARSRKGTKISLPLDGYEEIVQSDYIQFVRPKDSFSDSTMIEKMELGGLKLNFNLDITPDAEFEIIFDQKAGDIIRGNGNGNVKMEVDTEGDFSILGFYTIQEGKYNFTFANLVNKGFNIEPGSRISFNGDVYESQLDIRATYNKVVSLKPFIDVENVSDPENPEYRRPYPVAALLDLKGNFLSPEISLGLDLEEAKKTPNTLLRTSIYQLDNKIKNDEQERNRQVFSLLILNRLSPPNSFRGGSVGGTAGSSLSELISNQFSNWISQVDENLELSVDLDANDFNTFQLRLSYSLLDGRLRITRDGGFTNHQNQADFASVVGDWTIEYLLSPGGKYRIKMYNRTNQNLNNSVNLNNSSTTTAGFSLLHTASFNNFRELFRTEKKDRIEKEKIIEDDSDRKNNIIVFDEPPTNTASDSLKNKPEGEILHAYTSENEITLPLKHRDDTIPAIKNHTPSNQEKEETYQPLTQEEIKKQYLEGDEDNEPIPEWYLKKEDAEAIKKIIKELPENKDPDTIQEEKGTGFCPLPHRFDDHRILDKDQKAKRKGQNFSSR
ncbi:MAG: translocation/assembly module TamB domain-containing protein [Microscillaceae bacterium]|nr:translocation/assembly module TamB domain-containing protein [Microscillaceae bacterium]